VVFVGVVMSDIKFGPGGLGSIKDAVGNLERFAALGLRACEVEFVYGAYIKNREDAERIGVRARELGIVLSVHAPYFVNLNSKDKDKIKASRDRILKCCEVGSWMGAARVVFHPGFYSNPSSLAKKDSLEAKKLISEDVERVAGEILKIMEVVEREGLGVEVCPEVMGKVNVFGSIDEVSALVDKTGCGFCIDVAHVLARYGRYEFERIEKAFPQKRWHVHFSGIDYGEKGERKHVATSVGDWKVVLEWLKGLDKDVVLICEAPDPVGDVVEGKEIASL